MFFAGVKSGCREGESAQYWYHVPAQHHPPRQNRSRTSRRSREVPSVVILNGVVAHKIVGPFALAQCDELRVPQVVIKRPFEDSKCPTRTQVKVPPGPTAEGLRCCNRGHAISFAPSQDDALQREADRSSNLWSRHRADRTGRAGGQLCSRPPRRACGPSSRAPARLRY